jgi:lysozyme family protein
MRYGIKWPEYAKQWDAMIINSDRVHEFEVEAHFAITHKSIYQEIEKASGVTWPHIAVIHRREGNADFNTYLGNGQRLDKKTTEVPEKRGPFLGPNAFFNGAIDALKLDGLTSIKDWRIEKELYFSELFNGPGYDMRGLPSPYIWGGTNIQKRGKYIADRKFDPNKLDPQPGCAPLLWMIAKLDPTITFIRET